MHRTRLWLALVTCVFWPILSHGQSVTVRFHCDSPSNIGGCNLTYRTLQENSVWTIWSTIGVTWYNTPTGAPGYVKDLNIPITGSGNSRDIEWYFTVNGYTTPTLSGQAPGPAGSFYDGMPHASATPSGPVKTIVQVHNATDYNRTVKIDLDGDGQWDKTVELDPGELYAETFERETAPTSNGKVLSSGPNGDGSHSYDLATIPTGAWTTNPTPTTTPATISPGGTVNPNTAPDGKIAFAPPTGAASESTLKTGFSALATAIGEAGQSDAAILNRIAGHVSGAESMLHVLTNNTSRGPIDTSSHGPAFDSQKSSSASALNTTFAPIASTLGHHNATTPGTAPAASWPLGIEGKYGSLTWDPTTYPAVHKILGLLRAFFVWGAWFLFARHVFEYSRNSILETIKHAHGWQSSSAVPIASSASAVTMAALFSAGLMVAAGAIISAAVAAITGIGTFDSLQLAMIGDAEWGKVMYLANLLFPLNTLIALAFTEIGFRTTADTITASTLTASRWLVG